MSTRFTISVHQNGYYCVSIPSYHGGEVVRVEEYERLRKALRLILSEAEYVGDAKAPFSTWVAIHCREALNEQGNQPDQKEG